MKIGVPKEIKDQEFRIGLVPGGANRLVEMGNHVLIETGAGVGSGFEDEEYRSAGAKVVEADEVWEAELIVKVKEPQPSEWSRIRKGQTLFAFFHFASSRELTEAMVESGATCIAYETVRTENGHHPLLTPMSEIAGRLSVLQGAKYLERTTGGRGLLLCGVPGVKSAHVAVLGGGTVGASAAKVAGGLEARVTLMDINLDRLRYIEDVLPMNVSTVYASPANVRETIQTADIVIGAAHRSGAKAPHLLKREDLLYLREGSVLVDVAIDQGGCFETSRPTTHADPTFMVDGVLHYCVANMPGCVPRTSTYALTNATIPYVMNLASKSISELVKEDRSIAHGVNVAQGKLVHQAVAETFGMKFSSVEQVL